MEWKKYVQELIAEIKKTIKNNPFEFRENGFALLKEYLEYIQRATNVKYDKSSRGKKGSSKERKYQAVLYKQLVKEPRDDMEFFDLEFQTIAEMNHGIEFVKDWMSKGNVGKLHRGKPDYIAFNKEGFVIVELKTNNEACGGNAGLGEHNSDFENILLRNKENHIFVTELLRRLQIMYDFDLISDKWKSTAKSILEMKKEEIKICVKYMFITNPDFTKEMCVNKSKNYGFSDDECIIVES